MILRQGHLCIATFGFVDGDNVVHVFEQHDRYHVYRAEIEVFDPHTPTETRTITGQHMTIGKAVAALCATANIDPRRLVLVSGKVAA